jgi:hypothetical protein
LGLCSAQLVSIMVSANSSFPLCRNGKTHVVVLDCENELPEKEWETGVAWVRSL